MQILQKTKYRLFFLRESHYTFIVFIWGSYENEDKGDPINFVRALKEVPQNL